MPFGFFDLFTLDDAVRVFTWGDSPVAFIDLYIIYHVKSHKPVYPLGFMPLASLNNYSESISTSWA